MLKQVAHSANTTITNVNILPRKPCGGHLRACKNLSLRVGLFDSGFSDTKMGLNHLVMFLPKLLFWKKRDKLIKTDLNGMIL